MLKYNLLCRDNGKQTLVEELRAEAQVLEECREHAKGLARKGSGLTITNNEGGSNVTTGIYDGHRIVKWAYEEVILEKKYESVVAKRIGVPRTLVKEIDWKAHADSIYAIRYIALRRIIWDKQPTRSRMKIMKNHLSGRCPLCGEMDYDRHFLECQVVLDTDKYADLVVEKELEAEKCSIRDHLTNFVKVMMKGQRYSMMRAKVDYREPYD